MTISTERLQRPATLTPEFLKGLVARVQGTAAQPWLLTEVYTGEVLVELPQSTPQDIERAFVEARIAQQKWAATPISERLEVFKRAHTLLIDNAYIVADLIQAESGKNRRMAIEETCDPPMVMSHYIKRAPKLLAPKRRGGPVPIDRGPDPEGRHRHHRAVELPVRHRSLGCDPGPDRGQCRRGQARQQDRPVSPLRHFAA
jgi:succinate-semialdehyde dehydrogenase/glutarate-semialdehyde dehydrogenase